MNAAFETQLVGWRRFQAANPRRARLFITATLLVSAALALALNVLFVQWDGTVRVALVFYAAVVVPGLLVAGALGWGQNEPLIVTLAGGIGLGLAVAIASSSLLLRLKLPPVAGLFSWMVVVALAAGFIFIRRASNPHPPAPSPGQSSIAEGNGAKPLAASLRERVWGEGSQTPSEPLIAYGVLVFLIVGAIIVILTFNHILIPAHPFAAAWDTNDVLYPAAEFAANVENVQLRAVPRKNLNAATMRYTWSGWLYSQAMWSTVSQVDIYTLITRDLRPTLIVAWAFVFYAFADRLFKRHTIAVLAVFAQLYVNSLTDVGDLFTFRVQEDKFAGLFLLAPFALLVLLRAMERRDRDSYLALGLAMLPLGFVHPIAAPVTLLVAFPYVIASDLLSRFVDKKPHSWRSTAILLALLLVGLSIPFFDRAYAMSLPDGVGTANVTSTYGETASFVGIQRDPVLLTAFVVSLMALLFALKDRVALYIGIATAVLGFIAYTAPGAWLGVRLLTRPQLWRVFMLLPFSLAWAWIAWRLLRLIERFAQSRSARWRAALANAFLLAATSGLLLLMVGYHRDNIWSWLVPYRFRPAIVDVPQAMWVDMVASAPIVDQATVITPPEWSYAAAVAMARAHFLVANLAIAPEIGQVWPQALALYDQPDDASFTAFTGMYAPLYFFVVNDSPLDAYLQTRLHDQTALTLAYDGQSDRLYRYQP